MNNLVKISLSLAATMPLFAHAATLSTAIQKIADILGAIIPALFIIATIVFLWGVIQYITAGGDEEKIKTGRNYMIFGLIALFVMVAVWGIVRVLVSTFGVGGETIPDGPTVPPLP
jgi:hypothetical protein